jgi:2-keto-3-deoxy-L-rhamnonate aldolase RhmA
LDLFINDAFANYQIGATGYHQWADENVMCIVIIEQKLALDNVEVIAATPGIDLLFVGTTLTPVLGYC